MRRAHRLFFGAEQFHRRGNVRDRPPVCQEEDDPGTPGQARRHGRGPLPRQERVALRRGEADGEGGFPSTRHSEPFQSLHTSRLY